jgi:hypothetical protein
MKKPRNFMPTLKKTPIVIAFPRATLYTYFNSLPAAESPSTMPLDLKFLLLCPLPLLDGA